MLNIADGNVTLNNLTIQNGNAGSINYTDTGTLNVIDRAIYNNTKNQGCGISLSSGRLNITNSIISNNISLPILTRATSNRILNLNLTVPRNAVFGQVNSATLAIFNPPTPTPTTIPTPIVTPTLIQFSFACPVGLKPLEAREELSRESGRKLVVIGMKTIATRHWNKPLIWNCQLPRLYLKIKDIISNFVGYLGN